MLLRKDKRKLLQVHRNNQASKHQPGCYGLDGRFAVRSATVSRSSSEKDEYQTGTDSLPVVHWAHVGSFIFSLHRWSTMPNFGVLLFKKEEELLQLDENPGMT